MRFPRALLRLLAPILRVVALVVVLPVLAQAHAAHDHAARTGAGHGFGIAGSHLAEAMGPEHASVSAATDGSDRTDCLGCQTCCCGHVFVATADHDAVRGDRLSGSRVAMGADSVRPSAVAEALPEPPRPFA